LSYRGSVQAPPGTFILWGKRAGQVWAVTPDGLKEGNRRTPGATDSFVMEKFCKTLVNLSPNDSGFAAVTGDSATQLADHLFDLRGVHPRCPQEAACAVAGELTLVEFEFLDPQRGNCGGAVDAQQARGHVVGTLVRLGGHEVEHRVGVSVGGQAAEQGPQPPGAVQRAVRARLHDAVGVEAGERAARIQLSHCDIRQVPVERRSSRTGRTHPIGGFIGSAEYEGELAEFVPYLEAARWTGVGRQTVWGKGEILWIANKPSTSARDHRL